MKTQGFTLIEILVVIAIIAILAGIVGLNLAHKPAEAKVAATKMQVNILQSAVQTYRTEQGRVPTQAQGLRALVEKPAAEPIPANYPAEGYLTSRRLPQDAWGRDFIYLAPGRSNETFEIISYGSDGEPGGAGDAADLSSSGL
jgi:general secretion pathway protein G